MKELLLVYLLVAHRGASGDAPENTLPAFRLAWEQGADAIEGDFHLSKDNTIVCIHDFDTKRVAGEKHVVAGTEFSELRKLDVGSWKGKAFEGTKIPTLQEVMATVPEKKTIYIEVKCGPEMVPFLKKALDEGPLGNEQVRVISFNKDFLKAWEQACPESTTAYLVSFNRRIPRLTPSLEEVRADLGEIGCDGLSTNDHPALDRKTLRQINGWGYDCHVWTIDDPGIARRYLDNGASSVTTNLPGLMARELRGK